MKSSGPDEAGADAAVRGQTVLVTGGNGHVGNTLIKRLHARGYRVRATVRNPEEAEALGVFEDVPVEIHRADIRDEEAMRRAMEGVDGVFQVAALYHYDEASLGEGIVANNTDGCLSVLRAAKSAGVRRVVLTSSIAAVGFGGTEEQPLTEADWSDPEDPYCRSKLESEQVARRWADEAGLPLVVVCPGVVLGPNFYKHTPSTVPVAAMVHNQLPFRIQAALSVVDVRDLADAHILAYEHPQAQGRYLATGNHVPDLMAALADISPDVRLPERMLSIAESRALAQKSGTPLELVGQSYRYDDRRIRRELGWQPRPLQETLRDTVDWIQARDL
jgi:dihydroflavonol-4-reductase